MTMLKAAPSESSVVRINGVSLSAVTAVSEYERRSEKTITATISSLSASVPCATVRSLSSASHSPCKRAHGYTPAAAVPISAASKSQTARKFRE